MANIKSLVKIILPKKKQKAGGTSSTSTFNPQQTGQVLTAPAYAEHRTDIFDSRASQDSRELLKDLFKFDSDVSATVNAYLTIANTQPHFRVYNEEGELDSEGLLLLEQTIRKITQRVDYTTGFRFRPSLEEISEQFRYMVLLRGGIASELIFDKLLTPTEIRHIDLTEINWFEKKPGEYKPEQEPKNSNDTIPLDIVNFFVKYYRQNPTEVYAYSPFVASINTIAARQQVINDLYRIMTKVGYPRLEIVVMEDILRKSMPSNIAENPNEARAWMNARLTEIQTTVTDLRADAAIVHFDTSEMKILNEAGPSKSLNVEDIIKTLNAQNQSALKTMATIIGRGESGVNTASVEARVFSLSADAVNTPIASMYSEMFTLALRLQGFAGYVECKFTPSEMRPELELEPQKLMKQSRLLTDLSLGLISDQEYHMEVYHRPKPSNSPDLSGTNFQDTASSSGIDAENASPNSDPLGRALAPEGSESAKSNGVKK